MSWRIHFFFFFSSPSLFILLSSLNLVHHLVFKMVYSWVYLGTKQLSYLPQGYTAEQVLEKNSKTVSFVIHSQPFTTTTRPYHHPQGMHKVQWVVLHKNVIKSWEKLFKLQAMLGTAWAKYYWHTGTMRNYSNTKTGWWVIEDIRKWLFSAVFLSHVSSGSPQKYSATWETGKSGSIFNFSWDLLDDLGQIS